MSYSGTSTTPVFQSTPLVVEGRSADYMANAPQKRVSIHAPRCRGAKPFVVNMAHGGKVVSIHAPRCRGAKRR